MLISRASAVCSGMFPGHVGQGDLQRVPEVRVAPEPDVIVGADELGGRSRFQSVKLIDIARTVGRAKNTSRPISAGRMNGIR